MPFIKRPFSRRSLLISATSMAVGMSLSTSRTFAADPIRIGFGMSLTGPLAPGGKQCLLAMEIWRDEVNAKGGLIGRPVQLVYYDYQSNPANVPSLYAKLIDGRTVHAGFSIAGRLNRSAIRRLRERKPS